MSDEPEQIEPRDSEITEEWLRRTDEPEVRGVGAYSADNLDGWVVCIWAQEFWRQDPLGLELRERIRAALGAVPGATWVDEHDNEQWDVGGAPSGEALVRAAASVVDDMADRLRQAPHPRDLR